MDGRFNNPFVNEHEDPRFMLHTGDSPQLSGVTNNEKLTHSRSLKKNKRAANKRVVSVPIVDVDGSRLKGEGAPPSDCWAWRKYGQKPIKGSPYPRGYYRCSSSKGCPARKQVERSRVDPSMLDITYASEHNHSWPASKASTSITTTTSTTTTTTTSGSEPDQSLPQKSRISPTRPKPKPEPEIESELQSGPHFSDLVDSPLITSDNFSWFGDICNSSTVFDSPIYAQNEDADMAMIFPMREEDESLFADLGELPECSLVFRRDDNLRTLLCESTR